MRHFRRTLLTMLVLAVVLASLVGHTGVSSASSSPFPRDPLTPTVPPPPGIPDPNTGEPDSGSSRGKKIIPTARRIRPADEAQYAARALRMVRWSSFVWAERILGLGP